MRKARQSLYFIGFFGLFFGFNKYARPFVTLSQKRPAAYAIM